MLKVIDTKWRRGPKKLKGLKLVLEVFGKKYKLNITNINDIKKFVTKLDLPKESSIELESTLENYLLFNQQEYLKIIETKHKLGK